VFAWATAVDGEPLWAMMDTGSPVTALALEAPLGQRLWPTARPVEAGRGLSNAPVEARAVTAQVDFAGVSWRAQVAVMKLPLRECGTGALLGMNLLGHCSVTVARDRGWARCQP
jgi:predicted aspartyl protease